MINAELDCTLASLETPCLLLDRSIMHANIARMAARCEELGVALRPHIKTPKSLPIARALMDAGACGLTTSTLNEAEYLFKGGLEDIFYAVPVDGAKVSRIARLLRGEHRLSLLTDNLAAARQLIEESARNKVVLPLWIEIDVDHYRTGIESSSGDFEPLVRTVAESASTRLAGLMSYAGASYGCAGKEQVAALTERHRNALLAAADMVERFGLPRPRLSFGSTPAVLHARSLMGIDEVRCGIYVFQDLFQTGIGACNRADIAVSVLATVIGHLPQTNRIVIDAGGLALSKDRSTRGRSFDAAYGIVCDISGQPIKDLWVEAVSQELGIVASRENDPIDFARLPIGARVRVLPNHADMTAAAYEAYNVLDNGAIATRWERTNRW